MVNPTQWIQLLLFRDIRKAILTHQDEQSEPKEILIFA